MPSLMYQQTKDFTRWITDDRFLGQWYVSDAEGVNIRKSSRGVVLNNNTRTSSTQLDTWYNQIYAFIDWRIWPGVYHTLAICNTKVWDTVYWTLYTVITGANNAMRNAWIVKSAGVNYAAVITQWYVWRRDNDTSEPWSATNVVTLSWLSEYRPLLYDGGFLYVWWDGVVDAIDVSTSTWILTKTLNVSGIVRGITKIGDQIYVYSNDGLNGYKNSWDGVTNYPLYIQKWTDNPVLNVANIWNQDYVITGIGENNLNKYRRLFISAGWDKKLIYGSSYINYTDQLFNFSPTFTNGIETVNNTVFIAGKQHIYGYGNTKASLPVCLSKDYIISPELIDITALYVKDQSTLYIGYQTAETTPKIKFDIQDIRDGYAYWTEWRITTLAFDGWDIETEKTNNRIIVNATLPSKISPSGSTSIDIYTRVNNTDEWVFDISGYTEAPVKGSTYTYNSITYTVKELTAQDELICTRVEAWAKYDAITYDSWVLTKTGWPWDTSITFSNVDNFVFLSSITDTTKRKHRIEFKKAWYELEIKAVLKSTQQTISPELFSIKTLFDYKDKDDG